MAYQVLARKYRPQRFSDVVGQDHVTRTLLNALAQNRIAHGYIFSGHRGIGKTTIARILASALNCRTEIGTARRPSPEPCQVCESCMEIRQGNAVDVIEIDAATNRGIDEIRELRDAARYRPSRDRYRIYILDEAHQITDAAFNALLKTLEEPPEHIVFMMATTQPEDIPQTIRSRCQHFSFHAVTLENIVGQLRRIATAENIDADDATLALLAEAGDGSMRDALSIMDQAIASAPTAPAVPGQTQGRPALRIDQVRELMGSVSNVVYEEILAAVHANNSADVLSILGRLLDAGNGAPQLARQFVRYLRNAVVAKITQLTPQAEATGIAADLLQISPEERSRAARSAALFTEEELSRFLAVMLRTFDELGYRQEQRFHLELGLLKLVHLQRLVPVEELLSQLGARPAATPSTTPTFKASSLPGTPSGRAAEAEPVLAGKGRGVTPESAARQSPAPLASPSSFESDRARRFSSGSSSPPAAITGSLALSEDVTPAGTGHAALQPAIRPRLVVPPLETPANGRSSADFVPVPPAPGSAGPDRALDFTTQQVAASACNPENSAATVDGSHLAVLQSRLVAALAAVKGQQSASELIEEATLSLDGETLRIETTLSKTILPVAINADAQRLLQATLREAGPAHGTDTPLKMQLLPGSAASSAAPRKTRSASAGSAAELAEKHPVVQQAKRIFSADISNVIDLRNKESTGKTS